MEEKYELKSGADAEDQDEKIAAKLMRGFKPPQHSGKCKLCYGRGYVGFMVDPKTGEKKKAVCPKYEREVSFAVARHIDKMKKYYADREENRLSGTSAEVAEFVTAASAPKSFDSMIKGS